jgi:DNA end-binding protein Ku
MRKRSKRRPGRRPSWKGSLRFGLVSIEVEALSARATEGGDIHFHQLHAKCHRRIHYEKVCPVHGQVPNDEIVSGYEYAKGKYVEVDAEELDALRTEREKSLVVDSFIEPSELDLIFFDGRMYYLVPATKDANESYEVFLTALEKRGRWGVGHLVMSGKDQIAAIRADNGVLQMAMLNYPSELRPASEVRVIHRSRPASRQLRLAEQLIESWAKDTFDFEDYEDRFRNRVVELIQQKIKGKETVEPATEEEEEPEVINFMDALKKSVAANSKNKKRKPKRKRRAS